MKILLVNDNNVHLKREDFTPTIDGVLIKYNSNIIKPILKWQEQSKKLPKTESKLKQMEISFEQINNSRNDLIRQLGEQEQLNEKLEQEIEKLKKIIGVKP